MPSFRYVIADVFTDTPLAGNQLAVFTDARELAEELMQPLALEIGFAETVFVLPAEQGGHARLRSSATSRAGSSSAACDSPCRP
jgi:trans-2,3-dihydro-3-hydroxyanthranilate isomerase